MGIHFGGQPVFPGSHTQTTPWFIFSSKCIGFHSLHFHFLCDLYLNGLMSALEARAARRRAVSLLTPISRNECLTTGRRNTSTSIGSQWAFLPVAPCSRTHVTVRSHSFCSYGKVISQLTYSRRSHRRLGCASLETSVPIPSSLWPAWARSATWISGKSCGLPESRLAEAIATPGLYLRVKWANVCEHMTLNCNGKFRVISLPMIWIIF